jgi:hypothetical protein
VPGLVDLVVRIFDVQVRIEGYQKLYSFQMVEISADLRSGKDAPDLIDERRLARIAANINSITASERKSLKNLPD